MIAKRVLASFWGVFVIPALILPILAQWCDSPFGCSGPNSFQGYLTTYLFFSGPVVFLIGAVGGWLPEKYRTISWSLVTLPIVWMLIFFATASLYLSI
ncbi:MAG TPA: hypothetical protein VG934_00050 [Candidatus Paceibacterota bacterium]|nr:hypothetical protein [Candidatus Paceibacterota bacterium]